MSHLSSVHIAFSYFFVGDMLGDVDLNFTLILMNNPLKVNQPTTKGNCEQNNEGTVTEGVYSESIASQPSTP